MVKTAKEDNLESKLTMPRRRFMSAALLSGAALLTNVNVRAADNEQCPELLSLPTPADALVDLFDFFMEIERSILGIYYKKIGKISGEVSSKYSELKKLTAEFRLLVPELKADTDLSRFQNATELGKLSAVFIGNLPATNNTAMVDSHSSMVKLASNDLEKTALNWKSNQESLTLSPLAVEKLREMLKIIRDLEAPVTKLEVVSKELTKASNNIRKKVGEITPLIKDSIRLLVAAEILSTPTLSDNPADRNIITKLLKELNDNEDPTTVEGLRKSAVEKLNNASTKLEDLVRFEVPEDLNKQLNSTTLVSPDYDSPVPTSILQKLLKGIVSWIERGNEPPPKNTSQTKNSVKFITVSMPISAAWISELWDEIRKVLADLVPQATTGRTGRLYARKLAASIYSEAEQRDIFYNLLPKLGPPSEIDLYDNETVRLNAATRLARL